MNILTEFFDASNLTFVASDIKNFFLKGLIRVENYEFKRLTLKIKCVKVGKENFRVVRVKGSTKYGNLGYSFIK